MKELERELAKYSGSVIRKLRREANLTQRELGEKVGVSNSAIANYEKGYRAPLQDTLFALADFFNISVNDFFPNTQKEELDILKIYNELVYERQEKVYSYASKQLDEQNSIIQLSDRVQESTYKEVDLYGGASAGTGQQVFDNPVDVVSVPSDIIPLQPFDIMLKVVGDSMEPAFEDGEYIFVNKTQEIRSGQFVVVIVDGESYLKKIYIEDDHVRLVSLNKEYDDIIVDSKQDINIVGTVVL